MIGDSGESYEKFQSTDMDCWVSRIRREKVRTRKGERKQR
jgi:hypothetical protein